MLFLKVGMKLSVFKPDDVVRSVRISQVEDDRAEAVMTSLGEEELGPKVGWRLSTQASWHV